jgi:hypothetical protein
MAETASAPFRRLRREKRVAMISPIVGLAERLWAGPSASSRRLVLKPEALGGTCSFMVRLLREWFAWLGTVHGLRSAL